MFDIVIVGHGRKKRLFIKSDIQLLFFEFVLVAQWRAMGFIFFCDRFTCVANLIVNFIPLFTDAERGERFQFHLQRPDVHREKGIWWAYIHAFFYVYIYIYIYTCLKEGIFRVCRGSLIFTTTFGLAPLRERHKKSECFVTTWSLFTERARASRLIASRPSEIVDLHYLFLSKIVMTWRSLTQVAQNMCPPFFGVEY